MVLQKRTRLEENDIKVSRRKVGIEVGREESVSGVRTLSLLLKRGSLDGRDLLADVGCVL